VGKEYKMETTATQKGQIVIPASVRRKMGIRKGTRIKIEVDENTNHIILMPMTRDSLRRFRGLLKVKPGEKTATQQLQLDRAEDRRREEEKLAKYGTR
jgi:AbrB family looped-hinge helix DNA binding protein